MKKQMYSIKVYSVDASIAGGRYEEKETLETRYTPAPFGTFDAADGWAQEWAKDSIQDKEYSVDYDKNKISFLRYIVRREQKESGPIENEGALSIYDGAPADILNRIKQSKN